MEKSKDKKEPDTPIILVDTKDGRTITREDLIAEFGKEFLELSTRDEEFLSNIVVCHLMIEHYMFEFLQETNLGIGDLKKADLKYPQLSSLIKSDHPTLSIYLEGINCINTIRNNYAHNLNYHPQLSGLRPLIKCLNKINAQFNKDSMIEVIKAFTINCCGGLYTAIKVIGPTH